MIESLALKVERLKSILILSICNTHMDKISKFNFKSIAVCGAIVAVLLNGGLRLFNIWLSPTGRVLDSTIFSIWIAQAAIFIVLVLNFVFRSTKGEDYPNYLKMIYIAAGIFFAVGLLSIPIGNMLAAPIRQDGYEAFVEENRFLIEAIEAFEQENGRSPESLEELFPNHLPSSIATLTDEQIGDDFRPKLELDFPYSSIDTKSAEGVLYSFEPGDDNDPWQLQVSIYLGSFQSVRFVYNPEEKYSNRYTRVKQWGLAR